MSRYEQVVIDTALPFDQVVDTTARLPGDGWIIESAGAEAVITDASGVTVMAEKADLEDSHGCRSPSSGT